MASALTLNHSYFQSILLPSSDPAAFTKAFQSLFSEHIQSERLVQILGSRNHTSFPSPPAERPLSWLGWVSAQRCSNRPPSKWALAKTEFFFPFCDLNYGILDIFFFFLILPTARCWDRGALPEIGSLVAVPSHYNCDRIGEVNLAISDTNL